jgi:hypothetical protein
LKESGAKLPTTHLIDPIASLRQIRIANWTLPLLARKEKKLRKKFSGKIQSKHNFDLPNNSEMRVY